MTTRDGRQTYPADWHQGEFVHSTLVTSGLFSTGSPPTLSTCRTPRGDLRCACGRYDLVWFNVPPEVTFGPERERLT